MVELDNHSGFHKISANRHELDFLDANGDVVALDNVAGHDAALDAASDAELARLVAELTATGSRATYFPFRSVTAHP